MPQGPIPVTVGVSPTGAAQSTGQDAQRALFTAARHGDNYEISYAKSLFVGANQTGATTSAALATTYTGLCLSNPAGSLKNLSILKVSAMLNVAPAALTAYGLITGFAAGGITAHTTALTVQQGFVGTIVANPSVANLDAACTLVGTPIWSVWMGETASATGPMQFFSDIYGALIIPPGGYVAIGSTVAGAAAGLLGSFIWEENPL